MHVGCSGMAMVCSAAWQGNMCTLQAQPFVCMTDDLHVHHYSKQPAGTSSLATVVVSGPAIQNPPTLYLCGYHSHWHAAIRINPAANPHATSFELFRGVNSKTQRSSIH